MEYFDRLANVEEAEQLIEQNDVAFLYISQENCSVCHGLKPQVKKVMDKYPKIQAAEIRTDDAPEVASKFHIFTVPVLILFVDGKEHHREARSVYMQKFDDKIKELYENYFD
uniref:thioredoxin family protein n=1 Tax=uncultured Allobacillus sp. TaxID=1638025 RepID=UPI002595B30B|nr:thioredoxin family protein [uncultured Allobacillus sp.]